jgi:hypothetical protein
MATDTERGRALLEARREKHRECVIFDNTNRRFVLCAECKQSWPCEQSLMLDLALAADRRRQNALNSAMELLRLLKAEDAALDALLAHLAGEAT